MHSHGRRNLTKKKLKKLEKEELCEQLIERMHRARDVYSTFRVELREVLREKGKVSRLFAAPAHVSSSVLAPWRKGGLVCCLLLARQGADGHVCCLLLLFCASC